MERNRISNSTRNNHQPAERVARKILAAKIKKIKEKIKKRLKTE